MVSISITKISYYPPNAGEIMTTDAEISDILQSTKRIALVGASAKTDRPSYEVMAYLLAAGYEVIPVNPGIAGTTLHDQRVYATLDEIPGQIDMVDVFRESAAAPSIADAAIRVGAKTLWLQLGVSSTQAEEKAKAAGLHYVENRCVKIDHARLKIQRG
jgi:predicted CoA-binding protein